MEPVQPLGFGGLCAGDFCWPFAASNPGRFPAPKPKRLRPSFSSRFPAASRPRLGSVGAPLCRRGFRATQTPPIRGPIPRRYTVSARLPNSTSVGPHERPGCGSCCCRCPVRCKPSSLTPSITAPSPARDTRAGGAAAKGSALEVKKPPEKLALRSPGFAAGNQPSFEAAKAQGKPPPPRPAKPTHGMGSERSLKWESFCLVSALIWEPELRSHREVVWALSIVGPMP